jgi:hypothetical protein
MLLAREPRRLAASISNAAANLSTTAGAKPDWWVARLLALGPACANLQSLLDCGKVLAWQAGMVRFRASALEIVERLPPQLAAQSLGLDAQSSADALTRVIGRLRADVWLTAEQAAQLSDPPRTLRIVGRVGDFRGFGGVFLRPPSVGCLGQSLFVSDGSGTWELLADAYGSELRRTSQSVATKTDSAVQISAEGQVRWESEPVIFSELSGPQSYCAAGRTLAVTLTTSHHVYLLARVPTDGG